MSQNRFNIVLSGRKNDILITLALLVLIISNYLFLKNKINAKKYGRCPFSAGTFFTNETVISDAPNNQNIQEKEIFENVSNADKSKSGVENGETVFIKTGFKSKSL